MTSEPTGTTDSSDESGAPENGRPRWVYVVIAALSGLVLVGGGIAAALTWGSGPEQAYPDSSSSPSASDPSSESPSATPSESSEPSEDPSEEPGDETVDFDESVDVVPGVVASIAKLEAVDGEASGPGEVAGPSVRVTVSIVNDTTKSVALDTAVIVAYYGSDQTPAAELSGPGVSYLPASVGAGKSVTGTYVFSIPVDQRDDVRIVLDYSVDVPPLVFRGSAPTP